ENADEREGEETAQHHQVALGEIDDFGGLVNQDESKRDQAVDAAERNATDQLLNEVQHCFPPRARGNSRDAFAPVLRIPPFSENAEGLHVVRCSFSAKVLILSTKRWRHFHLDVASFETHRFAMLLRV